MTRHSGPPEWLTTGEVSALLRVDPKTPSRWEAAGKLGDGNVIRTPGGHRRFRTSAVLERTGGMTEGEAAALVAALRRNEDAAGPLATAAANH